MDIQRSALVEHPAARMFELIEAVEHYPAFVPWCLQTTVLERTPDVVAARIKVGYRGVALEFTTRNRKIFPRWMSIHADSGPFRRFEGEWHLRELGPTACRIDFELHYEFERGPVAALTAPILHHVASNLVHAFVTRAEALRESRGAVDVTRFKEST